MDKSQAKRDIEWLRGQMPHTADPIAFRDREQAWKRIARLEAEQAEARELIREMREPVEQLRRYTLTETCSRGEQCRGTACHQKSDNRRDWCFGCRVDQDIQALVRAYGERARDFLERSK